MSINQSKIFHPFKSHLELESGKIGSNANCWDRKLSEMTEIYDQENINNQLDISGNTIVYRVYEHELPYEKGHLIPVTTILYPGRVGNQFFMTKGHYHENRGTAEVYLILNGEGVLTMQTEDGQHQEIEFSTEDLLYIPPFWAHRMVNTSISDPLIFYGIYPADAGHDYQTIVETGFKKKVIYNPDTKRNFSII